LDNSLIIISIFIFILYLLIINQLILEAHSLSPFFSKKEIIDPKHDQINKLNRTTELGSHDITEINYVSNGKILNATLLLLFPFKEIPKEKEVSYGMLIDADFNSETGLGGIDYKIEIQWDNYNKKWDYLIESLFNNGEIQVLEKTSNYTNFYQKHQRYVTVSVDLQKLLYPEKYRVISYTSYTNKEVSTSDFTRWIAIPSDHISITPFKKNIVIFQGEEEIVPMEINSTQGYESIVTLNTLKNDQIAVEFIPNKIHISDEGTTTVLKISIPKDADLGEYPLLLSANSTFDLITIPIENRNVTIYPENVISKNLISVTVIPPPPFFVRYGDIISTIALLVFIIIPTMLSLKPSFLTKRLPDLISINNIDILHVNAAIIAGVLIFLSLEGSDKNVETRITLITANIVFPFAISTLAALTNHPTFSIRLMVSGFINLMISIILIAFIKT
jgi:hypothetical protein